MSVENGPQLHSFATSETTANASVAQKPEEDHGNTIITEERNETQTLVDVNTSFKDDTIEEHSTTKEDTSVVNADYEIEEGEDEISGTSMLPLSKIKKIFKTDPEHVSASEAAVFTTAVASELFIQYFTEQASLIARSENRKKVQYKDFSAAVSNIEQLHFLSDTVPKTYNLKKLVDENKVKYSETNGKTSTKLKPLDKGQLTLDFGSKTSEQRKAAERNSELPASDDEQDFGEGANNADVDADDEADTDVNVDADLDNEGQNGKDTDDDTDEGIEGSNDHIRKDKDHDVIMD